MDLVMDKDMDISTWTERYATMPLMDSACIRGPWDTARLDSPSTVYDLWVIETIPAQSFLLNQIYGFQKNPPYEHKRGSMMSDVDLII